MPRPATLKCLLFNLKKIGYNNRTEKYAPTDVHGERGEKYRLPMRDRNNTYYIIMEGVSYTVVFNLYNPFVQMFVKRLGAQDLSIALLNSIPPLAAVLVLIPFGILIEKMNLKKETTLFMIFLGSLFFLAILFVPFLPGHVRVAAYVVLIGLMNCPGALYLATWQSFFADIFSGNETNRVYSLRSKYGGLFGLLTLLGTGIALTSIPKTDGQRIVIYQCLYLACFLVSLLQIHFLAHVREPEGLPGGNRPSRMASFGKSDVVEMLRDKGFLIYCGCVFLFHVTWQMGWPLFFIYNVDYAKLNEFQLGIINVAAGLSQFLTFSFWSKWIEKKGSRLIIIFGALGLAMNPLFYFRLFGFHYLILVNIFAGISGACFTLSLFSGLIEMLPPEKKTVYTSVFNTFINISGFISPLIGIWIYHYVSIYHSMLLIGCFRILAAGLFAARWRLWRGKRDGAAADGTLRADGS